MAGKTSGGISFGEEKGCAKYLNSKRVTKRVPFTIPDYNLSNNDESRILVTLDEPTNFDLLVGDIARTYQSKSNSSLRITKGYVKDKICNRNQPENDFVRYFVDELIDIPVKIQNIIESKGEIDNKTYNRLLRELEECGKDEYIQKISPPLSEGVKSVKRKGIFPKSREIPLDGFYRRVFSCGYDRFTYAQITEFEKKDDENTIPDEISGLTQPDVYKIVLAVPNNKTEIMEEILQAKIRGEDSVLPDNSTAERRITLYPVYHM